MNTTTKTTRWAVLQALDATPVGMTSRALAGLLGVPASTVRARITELVREGLVIDSGQRVTRPNGLRATVWTTAARRQRQEALNRLAAALEAQAKAARPWTCRVGSWLLRVLAPFRLPHRG